MGEQDLMALLVRIEELRRTALEMVETMPREELVRELHQSLLLLRTKRLPLRMLPKEA
jgi:hypothetical protein